jgi:hypothetical protein
MSSGLARRRKRPTSPPQCRDTLPPARPLSIMVDFNELLDRYGDPYVWTILGKLKDLFGASQ